MPPIVGRFCVPPTSGSTVEAKLNQ